MYGIYRRDDDRKRTHAWCVTIKRRNQEWNKYFSDGLHGGKVAALRYARKYRDQILRNHPPFSLAQYDDIRRANNRSGVTGVCRYENPTIVGGEIVERPFWTAYWTVRSRRKSVKFSITRYGEKGAFKLACKARKKGLAELTGPYVNSKALRYWILHKGQAK